MASKVVPWSSGLFDCFSDVPSCCLTWCCPCITFGRISEIVDQGSSSCCGKGAMYAVIGMVSASFTGYNCAFLCSHSYRTKMRKQYSLADGACHDCLLHCFCEPCALCQEYRELKSRGFNMSLGWEGNMRKNGEVVIGSEAPGVEQGMTRDCTVPLMSME